MFGRCWEGWGLPPRGGFCSSRRRLSFYFLLFFVLFCVFVFWVEKGTTMRNGWKKKQHFSGSDKKKQLLPVQINISQKSDRFFYMSFQPFLLFFVVVLFENSSLREELFFGDAILLRNLSPTQKSNRTNYW